MSLETKVKQVLENFDDVSSNELITILNQIQNQFHNTLTKDYLQGKLNAISEVSSEGERKILCKHLKPYFDWYLAKN
ncbi:MAG: hypothetical protein OEL77_05425 [Nitrosopumilus sp.]|nr:hypothetical protein [Nitrosopumilus sp.]MDH3385434.1 hypothetical protein [Nitrosopumilus sp.]